MPRTSTGKTSRGKHRHQPGWPGRERGTDAGIPRSRLRAASERTFRVPDALTRPGVYVIDFIGNGMSSRVVVRKGKSAAPGADDHRGAGLYHSRRKQPRSERCHLVAAGSRIHGHHSQSDKEWPDRRALQRTRRARSKPSILSAVEFRPASKPSTHEAEVYSLQWRESMSIANRCLRCATQSPRAPGACTLNSNTPVTLSRTGRHPFQDHSTDLDGIATTKEVAPFESV